MSQSFLEAVLPTIAPALDALAPDPRSRVVLERLTPFAATEIVVARGGRPWRRLVGRTLPLGEDHIAALERCGDAMADADVHSIARLPGAWCALGGDGLSPALLPHDGTPRPRGGHGPLLHQALRAGVRCALLGAEIPDAIRSRLPAHGRLALEIDRQRLSGAAPPGPDPILVWCDGARAIALAARVLETRPARIVPLRVLAAATLHPPSPARDAPPALAGAPRAPSRRIPR